MTANLFTETWVFERILERSAAFVDDEVDAFGAFPTLLVSKQRLWLPIARVNDVGDALSVLKPPPITIVAQEVEAYVSFSDLELCDLRLTLPYGFEAFE